jgi:RimJ/RimL family protein N-acetyltransferase
MQRIETNNLLLRKYEDSDLNILFEIQRNKEAMQYTFCDQNKEDAKKRFNAYAALLNKVGFAPWTVLYRSNKKIIGWGGLNEDPFAPGWGVEVAYFFHSDYWGRGLATELVTTSIKYGFKVLNLKEIGAFVHQFNIASTKVLKKCGFSFVKYEKKLDRNYYVVNQK